MVFSSSIPLCRHHSLPYHPCFLWTAPSDPLRVYCPSRRCLGSTPDISINGEWAVGAAPNTFLQCSYSSHRGWIPKILPAPSVATGGERAGTVGADIGLGGVSTYTGPESDSFTYNLWVQRHSVSWRNYIYVCAYKRMGVCIRVCTHVQFYLSPCAMEVVFFSFPNHPHFKPTDCLLLHTAFHEIFLLMVGSASSGKCLTKQWCDSVSNSLNSSSTPT